MLRRFFDDSGELVHFADVDGRIMYTNPAWRRALGYVEQEALKLTIYDILRPEDRDRAREGRRRITTQPHEKRHLGKRVWIAKGGEAITIEATVTRRIVNGRLVGMYTVGHDVTAHVLAARALHEATEQAEAASHAKTSFLANISHEIKTPLNGVLGCAQLLERDPTLTRMQRRNIETILTSAERLLGLLNDVLDLSKIEAGEVVPQAAEIDLHAMLDELRRRFITPAYSKGLVFLLDRSAEVPRYATVDEGRLRQVLVRILDNGLKFTEHGSVEGMVMVRRTGDRSLRLVIDVRDTGPGIAEDVLNRLFQPFGQARAGIDARGGAGLSLSLCRKVARLMGGDLTVTTHPGDGSTFRLEIPIQAARNAAASTGTARRVSGIVTPVAPRVLVVDDDAFSRGWLSGLLDVVGFCVRESASGSLAVTEAAEYRPDLILLDVRARVAPGVAFASVLRNAAGGACRAIVGLSSDPRDDAPRAGEEIGVDAVLSKPCRAEYLLEQIGVVLGLTYDYTDAPESTLPPPSEVTASIAILPRDLREALRSAVLAADYDGMLSLIERLPAHQAELAGALRARVEEYDYEGLARSLGAR